MLDQKGGRDSVSRVTNGKTRSQRWRRGRHTQPSVDCGKEHRFYSARGGGVLLEHLGSAAVGSNFTFHKIS